MKRIIIFFITLFFWISTNGQNGKFVETNDVKIYYETYGSGEPLLLLHGFLLSHQIWEPWAEKLPNNYQFIIPDLPGHGRSTNPSNEFKLELVAKDVYGLMDKLGVEHFKAIGHSAGAAILTHMATMDSSRITAMILVGAPSYFPDEFMTIARNMSYETLGGSFKALVESQQPGGEEQIRKLLSQFRKMPDIHDDISAELSTIKCQTLIIDGDRDVFFPVDVPVSIYRAIPNSYL
jgi:pimeloyl-ACP methyl ester carboxylesterase